MKGISRGFKQGMVRLLGDEPVSVPLFAILLSLLAGAVVILFLGKNPVAAYQNLLQGSGLLPKPSYAGYKMKPTLFFQKFQNKFFKGFFPPLNSPITETVFFA